MHQAYLSFGRLFSLQHAGTLFVTHAKSNTSFRHVYPAPRGLKHEIICDLTVALSGFYSQQKYPHHLRRGRFKDIQTGQTLIYLTNLFGPPAATICALYKARGYGPKMDSSMNIHAGNHCQETTQPRCLALHFVTGIIDHFFEEIPFNKDFLDNPNDTENDMFTNQLNLFNN
ncbi:MAG: hypothetical protein DRR42_25615 [Gammaproteobacteria bacterium]|nr:MAG: hypothetical protein DRR42_25615 [Gammaproteobacteria bacterium]